MTARAEQETSITFMRLDSVAHIYTSNTSHLRQLRRKAASTNLVTEAASGDGWAEFTVSAENFRPLLAIRAKGTRTAAQVAASAAAGERLTRARKEVPRDASDLQRRETN